ncbi:MAG: IreB family regulatory phosphoprotein [Clostridiales bacterium]|nr:IreB family regulatory phosphoprotein [Clostridiales bacterium]
MENPERSSEKFYQTQKLPKGLGLDTRLQPPRRQTIRDVILQVYDALEEKGYNPIKQLIGYIQSGDPTYITSHKGARKIITRVSQDDILEELFKDYLYGPEQH